jgi:hypothetical protein
MLDGTVGGGGRFSKPIMDFAAVRQRQRAFFRALFHWEGEVATNIRFEY